MSTDKTMVDIENTKHRGKTKIKGYSDVHAPSAEFNDELTIEAPAVGGSNARGYTEHVNEEETGTKKIPTPIIVAVISTIGIIIVALINALF